MLSWLAKVVKTSKEIRVTIGVVVIAALIYQFSFAPITIVVSSLLITLFLSGMTRTNKRAWGKVGFRWAIAASISFVFLICYVIYLFQQQFS